ncbi:uncharacterized protein LOC135120673 [Zophobas morio]|uniref:uncharacterized protein LOC135120673 n=1 Tax=Zophobas morio TaxID=2755281 RepID=UPI003083AF11
MSGVAFRVLFGLAWLLWVIALLGAGSMFYFPFVIFKSNEESMSFSIIYVAQSRPAITSLVTLSTCIIKKEGHSIFEYLNPSHTQEYQNFCTTYNRGIYLVGSSIAAFLLSFLLMNTSLLLPPLAYISSFLGLCGVTLKLIWWQVIINPLIKGPSLEPQSFYLIPVIIGCTAAVVSIFYAIAASREAKSSY